MQIRKGKPPGTSRLAGIGVELSREARVRLAWMDFYRRCDNVAHTCRHFGISRQTFYRWQRRYDPYDLTSLEEHSHRPRQCRQPTWAFSLEEKVLGLRLQFPRWVSMVGRILTRLQQQGTGSSNPRAAESPDRAAPCVSALTLCANPGNMRLRSPATGSKSIPSTSVPSPAWSSNSSPLAMSFPAGMCCKRTLAPPLKPPPSSSTLCSTVCRFLSAPS
jgi:transposase-like protein